MIRKTLYFSKKQVDFLKNKGLTFSEHIRRATDKYIKELKALNASASQSETKEGE